MCHIHGQDLHTWIQTFRYRQTIVRWQLNTCKQDFSAALLAVPDHAAHVGTRDGLIDTPQAVIASQFNDDSFGLVAIEQAGKTGKAALGRVSTDT